MPADYYADAAPAAEPQPADKPEESDSDSNVATLPNAVLGGKKWKPGDEIMLEIVQVNDDGVVVKYASEKGGEEEKPAQAESPMASMYEDTGGGNPGGNPGGGY